MNIRECVIDSIIEYTQELKKLKRKIDKYENIYRIIDKHAKVVFCKDEDCDASTIIFDKNTEIQYQNYINCDYFFICDECHNVGTCRKHITTSFNDINRLQYQAGIYYFKCDKCYK